MYGRLIKIAYKTREYAYVPYSKFKVGAVAITKNGDIYTGCNIECASYGGTICAERVALSKAISEGNKEFKTIVICSDSNDYTFPCGICRQFISEFNSDIEIVVANNKLEYKIFTLQELLPYGFTNDTMK